MDDDLLPTLGKGMRLDLPVRFCPKYSLGSAAPAAAEDRPTRGKGISEEVASRARFRESRGVAVGGGFKRGRDSLRSYET